MIICRNCVRDYFDGEVPEEYELSDDDCYFCVPNDKPSVKAYNKMIAQNREARLWIEKEVNGDQTKLH